MPEKTENRLIRIPSEHDNYVDQKQMLTEIQNYTTYITPTITSHMTVAQASHDTHNSHMTSCDPHMLYGRDFIFCGG